MEMRKFLLALGVAAVATTGLMADKCAPVSFGEKKEGPAVTEPADKPAMAPDKPADAPAEAPADKPAE